MKSMTSRKSISLVAFTTSILSASILSYQLSATAVTLKFSGGKYNITPGAGGFSLDQFVNLTNQDVDDLHVSFTYVDTTSKVQSIKQDYEFDPVPPGGIYSPPTVSPGSNITVYFPGGLFSALSVRPDGDNPMLTDTGTYWTKCGEKVSSRSKESVIASIISSFSNALIPPASAATTCPGVPEPSSAPATIIFGAFLGTSIFLKRKQLMRLTQKNGVQKIEAMKA